MAAPSGTGGTKPPDSSKPDSATNDTRPAPGSPADKFEQACEQNPAACG